MPERDNAIVNAVALAIGRARAEEVGGCFRPDEADQGECANRDCYCCVWCRGAAIEVIAAHEAALKREG